MGRPVKPRIIDFIPENKIFSPVEEDLSKEVIELKFEEVEAMRLKDIEKLSQEEAAKLMNVSRQTYQLIIEKAREKVSTSLIYGNPIHIKGGNYMLLKCERCSHAQEDACPKEIGSCRKRLGKYSG
jgi:predicted DNA-binding protein (UPF0251 family)